MLRLKKAAVGILAFVSSSVFAGSMGPVCAPGNVTVPCERPAWDFGGKALYLESSFGAANFPDYYTTPAGVENYQNRGNLWGWGFMLEGSYHYNSGNDVNLNWYHLNSSRSVSLPSGFVTDVFSGTEGTAAITITTKPTWDAVNLEFAQHVDYSPRSSVRFHGGAEYVRLKLFRIDNAYATNAPVLGYVIVNKDWEYNGFGPRAGADAFYGFANGLSIYAKSALGLYAGTSSFHSSTNIVLTGLTRNLSSMIIAPELEAKLGGSYTYSFGQGDLSLDAGWMWINYFGPLTNAFSESVHSENFGLQGPFLGLKWVGNLV